MYLMSCSKFQSRWSADEDVRAKSRRVNEREEWASRDREKWPRSAPVWDRRPGAPTRQQQRQAEKELAELHVQARQINDAMNEKLSWLSTLHDQGSRRREASGSTRHPAEEDERARGSMRRRPMRNTVLPLRTMTRKPPRPASQTPTSGVM